MPLTDPRRILPITNPEEWDDVHTGLSDSEMFRHERVPFLPLFFLLLHLN